MRRLWSPCCHKSVCSFPRPSIAGESEARFHRSARSTLSSKESKRMDVRSQSIANTKKEVEVPWRYLSYIISFILPPLCLWMCANQWLCACSYHVLWITTLAVGSDDVFGSTFAEMDQAPGLPFSESFLINLTSFTRLASMVSARQLAIYNQGSSILSSKLLSSLLCHITVDDS